MNESEESARSDVVAIPEGEERLEHELPLLFPLPLLFAMPATVFGLTAGLERERGWATKEKSVCEGDWSGDSEVEWSWSKGSEVEVEIGIGRAEEEEEEEVASLSLSGVEAK